MNREPLTVKVLTALKINMLALLSIPLLLISMGAKLFEKTLEKAMVFFGVGAAVLILMLLREIINNIRGFLEAIGTILAIIIVFGGLILVILLVIVLAGTIVTVAIAAVVKVLTAVADYIFRASHGGYSKLYDVCKSDYGLLTSEKRRVIPAIVCLFWSLL